MELQDFINVVLSSAAFLAGWIMRFIHGRLNRLEDRDVQLEERLHKIDVLVAGKYVTREEVSVYWAQTFAKLDMIESKLDKKADK